MFRREMITSEQRNSALQRMERCHHPRRIAEKAKEWHKLEKAVGVRRNVLGQHPRLQDRGDCGGRGFVLGVAGPGVGEVPT